MIMAMMKQINQWRKFLLHSIQGDERTVNMLKIASVAFDLPHRSIWMILGIGKYKNLSYEEKIKKLYRSVIRASKRRLSWVGSRTEEERIKNIKNRFEEMGEREFAQNLCSWWLAKRLKE